MIKSKIVIFVLILGFVALFSNRVFATITATDNMDGTVTIDSDGSSPFIVCYDAEHTIPDDNIHSSVQSSASVPFNMTNATGFQTGGIVAGRAGIYTCFGFYGSNMPEWPVYTPVYQEASVNEWVEFEWDGSNIIAPVTSTTTRIVTVTSPLDEATTTTTVTFSGSYYLSSDDASTTPPQYSYAPRVYLFVTNADGPLNGTTTRTFSFPITTTDTIVTFSTTTTLLDDTRYIWRADIQGNEREPLTDKMLGKNFYQFTTGNFDPTFGEAFDVSTCNPFSGFDISDCLYNLIFPKNGPFTLLQNQAMEDLGRRVPWGYVTRFIDILNSTTTSVSMPMIDYSFSSSSPMSSVGNIHFDPFTLISESGTLINEMKSDRADSKTVWEIFMPFINMFVYVFMAFMMIHDLTGIHASKHNNDKSKE